MTRSGWVWTADTTVPGQRAIPSMRVTGAVRRLVIVLGDQPAVFASDGRVLRQQALFLGLGVGEPEHRGNADSGDRGCR